MSSSLRSALEFDVAGHAAYHARQGDICTVRSARTEAQAADRLLGPGFRLKSADAAGLELRPREGRRS